ncbi:MAG: hypothetical protein CMC82_01790 [Flavobacteriaceae bacterium]|nr:hypothetical protein [Flavobacteriaceae bacterium]
MSLNALTQHATQKPTETSSGDRIAVVEVGYNDPDQALIVAHFQGKALKKEGEAMFGKARRLYNKVIETLLSNRASERPKQFKFSGDVGGNEHIVTINVRENGYQSFDDATLDKVKNIVGDSFVDSYITKNISAKVDFSLVPTDKQDEIAAHILAVNTMLGTDVVQVDINNKPKTSFHEARAGLTEEQDKALNKLVPISCAFGR